MTDDDLHDIVEAHPERTWIVPRTMGIGGKIGHGKSTVAKMIAAKFGHHEIAFADSLRNVCEWLLDVPLDHMIDPALKSQPLVGRYNDYPLPFDPADPTAVNRQIDLALGVVYGTSAEFFTHAPAMAGKSHQLLGANGLDPRAVRERTYIEFMRHIWVPLCNGKVFSPREIMQLVGTEIFRAVDPPVWTWVWGQTATDLDVVAPDLRFPNEMEMVRGRQGICIYVSRPGQHDVSSHVSETSLDKNKFDYLLINGSTLEDLWLALVDMLDVYAEDHKADFDVSFMKQLVV